ncbi:MAG TPA: hypothetical protein VK803_03285 [Steroidobacteraceae bacterium]|nr:hypothetical protein [Steroidobacteraceae bacterium]
MSRYSRGGAGGTTTGAGFGVLAAAAGAGFGVLAAATGAGFGVLAATTTPRGGSPAGSVVSLSPPRRSFASAVSMRLTSPPSA